jgi:hypothetical protein
MSRIAVDVVLLPSDEMTDKTIRANAELVDKFASEIVLNKENCLPHISLAMGCIDERDITPIGRLLELVVRESPLGELTVAGIRTSTNARGEKVSVFEVAKTRDLQCLHEKIMKKMTPYFSGDVTSEMIHGDEEFAETTLQWIKNYRKKASFENFFPHITIGFGEIESEAFPTRFTVSKLGLCHLGNHCTCREILASVDL